MPENRLLVRLTAENRVIGDAAMPKSCAVVVGEKSYCSMSINTSSSNNRAVAVVALQQ